MTGAITASGGAWNASIVSEVRAVGRHEGRGHGLGSYIAQTTAAGDFPKIILGIAVMSLFVTLFNRLLWRPMYAYAESGSVSIESKRDAKFDRYQRPRQTSRCSRRASATKSCASIT